MEREEIIEKLKENDENKFYKQVRVINVTIADKIDDYQRVALTLESPVAQCIKDKDGTIKKTTSNVIFTSTISILAVFKLCGAAFATNRLINNIEGICPLLCDSKIDIIQEFVPDGTSYVNPFSNNGNATTFEGDRYITHINNVYFSDDAKEIMKLLKLKMLGI